MYTEFGLAVKLYVSHIAPVPPFSFLILCDRRTTASFLG